MFWLGVGHQISSTLPLGRSDLTQCVTGPHKCTCRMAPKSTELFKHAAQTMRQTDRQTDDMEKWVVIVRIACSSSNSSR